ncbi:ABC transporter substrate-binding protein [Pseudonocardia adelaidensis]|uniref:ABC transporter substrate-binding protein n=1 Tax=Pseudonocardia adelaidensis TaxID=648754 RepID=A0ABP9NVS8_9PSEU
MRRRAVLAVALVLGMALAGCGGGSTGTDNGAGDTTVDVGVVQLPIFAPLYVADAKGYFRDAGLTVNIQNVKSGQDAIPLAASGKLDAVLAGFSAGMFSAIQSGLDVRVVGSMGVADADTENPASALIVAKPLVDDGTIRSVADLKGHKIGALGGAGATSAFYVGMALEEAGLTIKDVQFVQLNSPDIPTGLKTGGIDAAFVSAPFWSQAVADGIATKIWTTPEGTSGTGILYGGEFAKTPVAQKFFDALARGARDLQGDARYSDENLKIIGDATGQTPEQVKSVPLYAWLPNLAPLPDQLAAMERMWMQVGALEYDTPIPQQQYVDTTFADHVAR